VEYFSRNDQDDRLAMTHSLTPLAISALALLNERAMHPYEMYQLLLERHEDRIVRVTPGSLYRTVDRLTADGLARATGTAREGNRPERTTYEITGEGRTALVARIREILRAPINEFPSFALALSEAHNAPASAVCADLRDHLRVIAQEVEDIDCLVDKAKAKQVAEAYWVTADYIRHMNLAQQEWIRGFIDRLEKGDLPWPHPQP
jgi:DNA-binding PadR family transcriptional regulator